jgi:hypothetical protein
LVLNDPAVTGVRTTLIALGIQAGEPYLLVFDRLPRAADVIEIEKKARPRRGMERDRYDVGQAKAEIPDCRRATGRPAWP